MGEKRESFTNKIGFMLSCVGAAIGLGNIWLFSWKLGKYGGAAFLIPYFRRTGETLEVSKDEVVAKVRELMKQY